MFTESHARAFKSWFVHKLHVHTTVVEGPLSDHKVFEIKV